jgi:type II secretory pathway pseudopilin PulG
LIESIAVLAVLAILAAVLVPPVIRRVDRAAWTVETANLNTIADALTQSIIRTKTIPTFTNWSSAVASQMSLPVSAIDTNARRYARAFLIDPDLNINGAGLPYTQTTNGSAKPINARVMILSSLAQALPIASGAPTATDFNNIWNAAENTVPAGTPFSGWTGTGDDLRIKKLNLEPLFHQLILFNHDPPNADPTRDAPFSIDRGSTMTVSSGPPGRNRYYLESSDLWLFDSNFNLRTRYLLERNISFVFESGAWRGQIQGGETFSDTSGQTASDFLRLATAFYSAPTSANALNAGASPSSVLVTMYTFMFDYVFWATQCPNFGWHGVDVNNFPTQLPEYKMLNDIGQNSSAGTIDKYSGTGGLLK